MNLEIRIPLLPMVFGGQPIAEPDWRRILLTERDGGLSRRQDSYSCDTTLLLRRQLPVRSYLLRKHPREKPTAYEDY